MSPTEGNRGAPVRRVKASSTTSVAVMKTTANTPKAASRPGLYGQAGQP